MQILQLRKPLLRRPAIYAVPGVAIRQLHLPADVSVWLKLRTRAFAAEWPAVRPWTRKDFDREIMSRPGQEARRTWLAYGAGGSQPFAGSVTLARRGTPGAASAVVHWLMVDPDWRAQGIGQLLMGALERAAWDSGYREVRLETHAGWNAAVALYRKLGYQSVASHTRRPST